MATVHRAGSIRHTTPAGQASQEYHDRLILRSGPFTPERAEEFARDKSVFDGKKIVVVAWPEHVYVDHVRNFGGIDK